MKDNALRILLFCALFGWVIHNPAFPQTREDNHPELNWHTISTEHFEVHFHDGAERSARVVAKVAEDIYQPVTTLYDWHPDGLIHFIIKDHDDNSNGAAYYYDNKVEIWAPQMTFILRGTHNWLRNVVTHEFTHMISLGAARKITRHIPAFYLQMIGYESEKRPDVLYGYPNILASYPIAMTVMPMWLAEGMAQYQAPGLDYDQWDSHRDMLIRTAVLANKLHSFDEMGVFGKNSLGNERTYNAGYAFVRYIGARYGEDAVKKLSVAMSKPLAFSVDGALREVTGLPSKELYQSWRSELEEYYGRRLGVIETNRIEGQMLIKDGIGNVFPSWSPDGKKIAYCGSKSSDYLSLTSLLVFDISTGKSKLLKAGVNSSISWSADGSKLLYARPERGKHGSHFNDLWTYDLKKNSEKRLTQGLRAMEPAWSPDGKNIVCIIQKDGTDNLILLDANGKVIRQLTQFDQGEAVSSPSWSPDGRLIVFSQARKHGRDLKLMDVATGEVTPLIFNQGDARDPTFSSDGQRIYFSWDNDGIFNICSIEPDGSNLQQWTNVVGGAFMPSLSKEGKLSFSNFQWDGYKIALLDSPSAIKPAEASKPVAEKDAPAGLMGNGAKETNDSLKPLREYDDAKLPSLSSKPYSMTYGQLTFLPRVMLDSNRVKLGTYFYASDILDRYSVLGGAALNVRKDLDAFAIFEYRRLAPTLFLELYGFTRHIQRDIDVIEDYPTKAKVDIGFTILEADIGAYYRLTDSQIIRGSFVHSRYSSKISDFFFQNVRWVSPLNTYFKGNHFALTWDLDQVVPRLDSGINPSMGRKMELKYTREYNKFFTDFSTDNDYGTPQEIYSSYNYNRLELDWQEYTRLPWFRRHALTAHLRGGWVDRPIDSFFNFFAGGLIGLRGYPFYSIEGRKLLLGRFTYRFPLAGIGQHRFLNLTTDKLYLSAFFDYGNAFDGDKVDFSAFKRDAGAELRFSAFSFYGFPTAISVSTAYAFDKVVKEEIPYGREWRYYVSVLFDFIE
jgi:Tol biopolymer transport system component